MKPLLQSSICFLNDNIVTIYATLIAFALLSQFGTVLPSMVRHGKLRDMTQPSSNMPRIDSGDLSRWIIEGDFWMVKKQRFLDFYVLGTVALITVRLAATSTEPIVFGSSRTLAQTLLLLHLVRRMYECLYVHQWQSTSVMHLSIYVLGILYYALLPFIFCRFDCRDGIDSQTSFIDMSRYIPRLVQMSWQSVSFTLCLYAQQQQARHHLILANLRRTDKDKDKPPSSVYLLPGGGWFHWVACPHYLAEILIYIGLAGLLQDTERGVVIVTWVTVSLTINALQSQRWYAQNIPGYAKLNRRAIFPHWL